jgi:CHAD domain-containing protein
MTATNTLAYPIHSLREQVTALEAAITLCLSDPKTKPVHRLRTTTRRIEGQLAMLKIVPKVPRHRKQAGEARKLLKKLRRAAGDVRDIDVQLDLIDQIAGQDDSSELKDGAAKLREKLEADRKEHAEKLVKVLEKRQSEVTLALEELLKALKPIETLALYATELTKLAVRWYRKNLPPEVNNREDESEYLHTVRKVAKLARYIAENAPESAKAPRDLAAGFESLQQSGGDWHDWMVLEEIAGENVGKSSALTKVLARRNRTALQVYRRHLGEFSG